MPIPRIVGRWNKAGLNRVTRHIAPWAPGLGVVVHRGRRSGREYQTPVNVFSSADGYVFALTYGPETDWVKNVLAAGVLSSAVPLLCDLLALRRVPANFFSIFMSVNPVFAALAGLLVLGQRLSWSAWLAIGVVVAVNTVVVSRSRR